MSCTLSGHKWGAEGHKVQEIPQGSTDDGGGGPGGRCSLLLQKTPKGSALPLCQASPLSPAPS